MVIQLVFNLFLSKDIQKRMSFDSYWVYPTRLTYGNKGVIKASNKLSSFIPQVQDTSFILCIVYIQPEIPVKQLKNLNTAPSSKLLYHRLDLLGQPSSCLHFMQLATVGTDNSKFNRSLL